MSAGRCNFARCTSVQPRHDEGAKRKYRRSSGVDKEVREERRGREATGPSCRVCGCGGAAI